MADPTVISAKVRAPRKNDRVFVGKLWHGTGKTSGIQYDNITFDRGFEIVIRDTKKNVEYVLPENASIQAFPNSKREGKRDADMRLSFQIEVGA